MAHLVGPLFSFSASGSIAGWLRYSHRHGKNFVRTQRPGPDFLTPARAAQRTKFLAACAAWNLLSPEEKEEWNRRADLL